MQKREAIWEVEESLWLGGRVAYATHMAPDCLVAFSELGGIGPDEVLDSIHAVPRWHRVEMQGRMTAGGWLTLVLCYRAHAEREGERYCALCTSTYRWESGAWKLIQHQQSPC